jgi:hypothetical protein
VASVSAAYHDGSSDAKFDLTAESLEAVKNSIQSCVDELKGTNLYGSLTLILRAHCEAVHQIVCYGVGNFSIGTASAPLWQLACVLVVRELLQASSVDFFDPCTTSLERAVLKELNIEVIAQNERAQRCVECPTLFIMPHCPQGLYNNLLLFNWDTRTLMNVYILGNSLLEYQHLQIDRLSSGIKALLSHVQQEKLEYSKEDLQRCRGNFEAAFNDTYLVRITLHDDELPPKPPCDEVELLEEVV